MNDRKNIAELFDFEDAIDDLVSPDGSVPILDPDFDVDLTDLIGAAAPGDAFFTLQAE